MGEGRGFQQSWELQAALYVTLASMQGPPPSYRELVRCTPHLTNIWQVSVLLEALARRGLVLRREEGEHRSAHVTAQPVGELRDDQPLDAFTAAVVRMAVAPYRLRIGCRTLEHLHICAGDICTIERRAPQPDELALCCGCEKTRRNASPVHIRRFSSDETTNDKPLGVITAIVRVFAVPGV